MQTLLRLQYKTKISPKIHSPTEGTKMKILKTACSQDGITTKFTQMTRDGYAIETAYINHWNKQIICFSVQTGCSNQCRFCYNGLHCCPYRNLTAEEIIRQIRNVTDAVPMNGKPLLLSAMGIGDIGNNRNAVIAAIHALHDEYAGLQVRFAFSTIGNNPAVFDDAKGLQDDGIRCKVQISLHAASDRKRKMLMPNCPAIDPVLKKIKRNGVDAEYNVILLKNINDSDEDAKGIARLLERHGLAEMSTVKINRFNPVEGCAYLPSGRIKTFMSILKERGIKTEYYETNGTDINAACGQMIGNAKWHP